jgi:hypothetical protein
MFAVKRRGECASSEVGADDKSQAIASTDFSFSCYLSRNV